MLFVSVGARQTRSDRRRAEPIDPHRGRRASRRKKGRSAWRIRSASGRRSRGVEFAPDSPLEGDGFEPSVPREGPTRQDGFI
jgi:hypothetical protein